jgi:predicted amidohydrolase
MLSKTDVLLAALMILSAAPPASAATKHHRVTHVHRAIYNMVVPAAVGGGCTASGGPECSGDCSGSGPCAPPDRD